MTAPLAYLLLAFCVVAETVQQLCFKAGVDTMPAGGGAIGGALRQPTVWAAIVIWIVEVIAWVCVLGALPLTVAYPAMTLTYVGVPLGGMLLLREGLTQRQIAGAALVATGVLCVVLSEVTA